MPVTDLQGLQESISLYMTRAAEKLRRQQSYAGSVYVYIRTSPFRPDDPQYSNGMTIPLPSPTDDTRKLVGVALWALKRLYRPGYRYAKAGVMLSEIVPAAGCQTDLFADQAVDSDSERLMTVLDAINRKMGKDSVKLASEGMKRPEMKLWSMKQGNRSPCFTTKWDEIVVAR